MLKINIGGGYKRYEGFLNLDHDPMSSPDYIVDLEHDKLPFEDSTIDEVKAYHILEHIGDGFFHLLQELYRVCCDQAIIDIQVPHHRSEVWYGDPTHVRFITVDNMRLFDKKYNDWHIIQWNSSSGFGNKLNVDFEIFEYNFIPNEDWKMRFKEMTQEQVMEVSKNFNNVYYETHIKLMVRK
jgi:predicted SAM-dependent methyltransferase